MPGDIVSFPEKGGMLLDTFGDFGLFREQQLGQVLSGRHRFQVGRFALVIENRTENGRDDLEHLGDGRSIVGFEQRIEKTFEVSWIDGLEAVHLIGTEVAHPWCSQRGPRVYGESPDYVSGALR